VSDKCDSPVFMLVSYQFSSHLHGILRAWIAHRSPDLDSLDVEALKALAIRHRVEIAAQRAEIAARDAEIEQQRQTLSDELAELRRSSSEQIEHLKLVIEKLRRRVFGVKSEKIVIQLEQPRTFIWKSWSPRRPRWKPPWSECYRLRNLRRDPGASRLPEHLPREVVSHAFHGDCCPDCGGQLRQFGEDVSEQLEYIPDSFKVIRHVRPKFACSGCERVIEAPAPSRPIERGLAGPGAAGPRAGFEIRRSLCPSIASRRFTPAREWRLSAPRWRAG
jgi:transposase